MINMRLKKVLSLVTAISTLNRNEKVSSQRGDQTCTLVSLTAGSPIRLTVTKQEYVIGKSTEQADGVAGVLYYQKY